MMIESRYWEDTFHWGYNTILTYLPPIETQNKLKIGGIKTDLVSGAAEGPISWLTEGTMDVVRYLR